MLQGAYVLLPPPFRMVVDAGWHGVLLAAAHLLLSCLLCSGGGYQMLVPGPVGGDILPLLVAVQVPISLCCIPLSYSPPGQAPLQVSPTWSQALRLQSCQAREEGQCAAVHLAQLNHLVPHTPSQRPLRCFWPQPNPCRAVAVCQMPKRAAGSGPVSMLWCLGMSGSSCPRQGLFSWHWLGVLPGRRPSIP